MLSPDDSMRTEAMRQPARRTFDYRSKIAERRQSILLQRQQEKQQDRNTDMLPGIAMEPVEVPSAKMAWRQVTLLREENKRLEAGLESVREEMRQLNTRYAAVKADYEKELSIIHNGQQLELEQYHGQLQEVTGERNHLKEAYFQLERRYQELYNDFQQTVEEEARKMVADAAKTLVLTPDDEPEMMRDVMKTIKLHAQQVEDKQLVEVLYLKREVQRLGDQLSRERLELEQERQRLLQMQHTAREQAELRHKVVLSRLRTRWTMAVAFVTTSAIVLLVLLQLLFLGMDHVPFTAGLDFAIFAPILFAVIFSLIFAHPISKIRSIYKSAPHKKKS